MRRWVRVLAPLTLVIVCYTADANGGITRWVFPDQAKCQAFRNWAASLPGVEAFPASGTCNTE